MLGFLLISLTLLRLDETVEVVPLFTIAALLEVHVENPAFFLVEILASQDRLMTLPDHVHVSHVGGQRAVKDHRLHVIRATLLSILE